jgi:putative polyhydroxyalkanoate system protein
MADLDLRREHGLSLDEAKSKVEDILDELKSGSDLINIDEIDWNADRTQAEVSGKGFSGTLKVNETAVDLSVGLSFIAKPFKGKIEKKVEQQLDKHFG